MRRSRQRRGYTLIEVAVAVFLMAMAVLTFSALYPTAAKSSRMSGNYAQATSAVQHKIDQLRAVGYGRLTYTELRSAGVIDASPTSVPFRFEAVDDLAQDLPTPVGTIALADASTDVIAATVRLQWGADSLKPMGGVHEVTVLIPNE